MRLGQGDVQIRMLALKFGRVMTQRITTILASQCSKYAVAAPINEEQICRDGPSLWLNEGGAAVVSAPTPLHDHKVFCRCCSHRFSLGRGGRSSPAAVMGIHRGVYHPFQAGVVVEIVQW